ncbi:MAG: TerC family protein [Saprospiraceae bacterium]
MWLWILFILFIMLCLALDLGVFNKKVHTITYREAARWTTIWASIAGLFAVVIYFIYGSNLISNPTKLEQYEASLQYITGYLIELSLSVDNIFVIAIIFKSFRIPQKYQHRVLFWGILGAIVFRGLMIGFGVVLIHSFSWTTYLFGLFLIITAIKMMLEKGDDHTGHFEPKKSFVYRMLRKVIPITTHLDGEKFFIAKRGLYIATPLFLALLVIEFTDILFALDSIPAILSITTDPFLVFTSNIFAILGLRSMYFFMANMLESFHYLKYSLIVILTFVGIKLMLVNHYHIPIYISLGIIFLSLLTGILVSVHDLKKAKQ